MCGPIPLNILNHSLTQQSEFCDQRFEKKKLMKGIVVDSDVDIMISVSMLMSTLLLILKSTVWAASTPSHEYLSNLILSCLPYLHPWEIFLFSSFVCFFLFLIIMW